MALITKDDLKTELGLSSSDTTWDTLLTTLAGAVQDLFEKLTDRQVEKATFTEYFNSDGYTNTILLSNYPVIEGSVTVWDDPDWDFTDDDKIDSDDYTIDYGRGIIYYDGWFYKGFRSIKVQYQAGYDTDTLPDSWKQVWVRQACHWFHDAKNKEWALQSVSQPRGGTVTHKNLVDNLLPDFALLVQVEKRCGY